MNHLIAIIVLALVVGVGAGGTIAFLTHRDAAPDTAAADRAWHEFVNAPRHINP